MADNLSLSMTLRLRTNANACHRSAEQSRRALNANAPDTATAATTPFKPPAEPDEDHNEAVVIAGVAAAQKRAAEAQARMQTAAPPIARPAIPAQTLAAPQTVAAPMTPEQQWQSMWASAAVDVAAEFTADLPNLPRRTQGGHDARRRAQQFRQPAVVRCGCVPSQTGRPECAPATERTLERLPASPRHARACPGHPPLAVRAQMAGRRPAMTVRTRFQSA
jgi:hypothetical protein